MIWTVGGGGVVGVYEGDDIEAEGRLIGVVELVDDGWAGRAVGEVSAVGRMDEVIERLWPRGP